MDENTNHKEMEGLTWQNLFQPQNASSAPDS